jgi:hypothetical protein
MYERGNRVLWISPVFCDDDGTIDDPHKPPPPEPVEEKKAIKVEEE